MGNITTGLFWMHFAVRSKNQSIISHTLKSIIKADLIFTIPGVVLIVASGIWSALFAHFPMLKLGWILWPIILFSISGLVFGLRVAPIQKRMYNLTSNIETMTVADWQKFGKLMKEWDFWGSVALLTPFLAFFMMVLKIPQ
jgi:uncharacterized membrane protein